jgi:hypothetical protein
MQAGGASSGGASGGGAAGSGGALSSGGDVASGGTPEGGSASGGDSAGGTSAGGGDTSSGGSDAGTGGGASAPATYCRSFYNSSGGANPCYIGQDGKAHCIVSDGTTVTLSEVPGTIRSVTGWDYTTRACAVNDAGAVYCGNYGSMTEWIESGATQVSGLANGPCAIVQGSVLCDSISVPEGVDTGAGEVSLLGCYSDGCCAATDAPGLYCWGDTTENFGADTSPYEVPLPEGKQVLAIGAGQVHVCVLLEGGQVHCFGQDWNGQLGGLGADSEVGKTLVASGATGVAAGQFHTCVSLDTGKVECAGNAGVHGAGQNSMTLVEVPGISTAVAVTAGRYASCALLEDSTVQCWGDYGDAGQGNNETTAPIAITGPLAAACNPSP